MNKQPVLLSWVVQRDRLRAAARLDFVLPSGDQIETSVLDLPHREPSLVICTPSQSGCAFGCQFCGLRGSRHATNLTSQEIIELIRCSHAVGPRLLYSQAKSDRWQISFMGQGDPLANFDSVLEVIDHFLGVRKFVLFGISTIGIPNRLKQLSTLPTETLRQIKLQLSLHASLDPIRHELMPGTKGWSIREMLEVAKAVSKRAGRRVCLNYVLIDGINDNNACLDALASLADPEFFYVKLSLLNEIVDSDLVGSSLEAVQCFASTLAEAGCEVKIFHSAGGNIGAGCGQVGQVAAPISLDIVTPVSLQRQHMPSLRDANR